MADVIVGVGVFAIIVSVFAIIRKKKQIPEVKTETA
jgi:hypothetical protein